MFWTYCTHSLCFFRPRLRAKDLDSSNDLKLTFATFSHIFVWIDFAKFSKSIFLLNLIRESILIIFPDEVLPFFSSLNSSAILSSWDDKAAIIDVIFLKAVVSANSCKSMSSGTTMGKRIYPKFLPSNFLSARPAAWTISITLCLGSTNITQSIAGTSTPSVKHLALVNRDLFCSVNSFINSTLCPEVFLLEICRFCTIGLIDLILLSSSCCSWNSFANLMLLWKEIACLILYFLKVFFRAIPAARYLALLSLSELPFVIYLLSSIKASTSLSDTAIVRIL